MRLGEILIERKQLSPEDLSRALELQKERGDKLGRILVDLGFVAHRDILSALSEQLEVPLVTIDQPPAVSPELETLSVKFLRQFRILPIAQHDHTVTLAMADLARGLVVDVEHPADGTYQAIGMPIKLSATPMRVRRRPPKLGEHQGEGFEG